MSFMMLTVSRTESGPRLIRTRSESPRMNGMTKYGR